MLSDTAPPAPSSGLLSSCEHQGLQDVRQRYNSLDHVILIHHYKSVNLCFYQPVDDGFQGLMQVALEDTFKVM